MTRLVYSRSLLLALVVVCLIAVCYHVTIPTDPGEDAVSSSNAEQPSVDMLEALAVVDDTVRLDDAPEGLRQSHFRQVWSISFTPDGKRLLTSGLSSIKIWDSETGREVRSLEEVGLWCSMSLSPDARVIGGIDFRRQLRFLDLNGKELPHPISPQGLGAWFTFLPDKKTVAILVFAPEPPPGAVAGDGTFPPPGQFHCDTVQLWDLTTGRLGRVLKLESGERGTPVLSPDGELLAIATSWPDGRVLIWETASGKVRVLPGQQGNGAFPIGFTPDGKTLAMMSENRAALGLVDVQTGEERVRIKNQFAQVEAFAFAPDGKAFVIGTKDGEIIFYSPATGNEQRRHQASKLPITHLAFSPDGKILAACSAGRLPCQVRLWDVGSGKLKANLREEVWECRALTFDPNGDSITALCVDAVHPWKPGTLQSWNAAERKHLGSRSALTPWIGCGAFSADGRTFAAGSAYPQGWKEENVIDVLDTATGKRVGTLHGGKDPARNIAVSSGRILLAVEGWDDGVSVHDIAKGELKVAFGKGQASVACLAFSPTGKAIVTGDSEGTIRTWETESGEEVCSTESAWRFPHQIGFSQDEKLIAFVCYRNLGDLHHIEVWDRRSGETFTLGDSDNFLFVLFSPDGKTVIAGELDGDISLWDIPSQSRRAVLKGHSKAVLCGAVSPNGKLLATGSRDGTVRLWDLRDAKLIATFAIPSLK
jgi:WD40 repeat protein